MIETKQAYNVYDEPHGTKRRCRVCGATRITYGHENLEHSWFLCGRHFLLEEWDGSVSHVHAAPLEDGLYELVYQDGVRHVVGQRYFLSMRKTQLA